MRDEQTVHKVTSFSVIVHCKKNPCISVMSEPALSSVNFIPEHQLTIRTTVHITRIPEA